MGSAWTTNSRWTPKTSIHIAKRRFISLLALCLPSRAYCVLTRARASDRGFSASRALVRVKDARARATRRDVASARRVVVVVVVVVIVVIARE